jgi:hypothetical protein
MPGFWIPMPTHYAPGEGRYRASWCGIHGVDDRGLRSTRDPRRVTCKRCLASWRRYDAKPLDPSYSPNAKEDRSSGREGT